MAEACVWGWWGYNSDRAKGIQKKIRDEDKEKKHSLAHTAAAADGQGESGKGAKRKLTAVVVHDAAAAGSADTPKGISGFCARSRPPPPPPEPPPRLMLC